MFHFVLIALCFIFSCYFTFKVNVTGSVCCKWFFSIVCVLFPENPINLPHLCPQPSPYLHTCTNVHYLVLVVKQSHQYDESNHFCGNSGAYFRQTLVVSAF